MSAINRCRAFTIFLAAIAGMFLLPGAANAEATDVQTVWRLLDYVAVDYSGAVSNGRVTSQAEYAEMSEFSATIRTGIAALPPTANRASLIGEADRLKAIIAAKGAPPVVAESARKLASDLLAAYPVPLAPGQAPDPARGAALFAENCASCHGSKGDGRGEQAAKLDPPPIAFTDAERARKRSLFALYQVINQGLEGTAMQSFADLPSNDRWALATYAGGIAFRNIAAGERLWKTDPTLPQRIPDLQTLAGITPEALGRDIGQDKADAVIAYLRANPQAIGAQTPATLAVARDKLTQSLAAYNVGDSAKAERLALSAYLDGFEPLEPILTARDATLMTRIEVAMGDYRSAIGRRASPDDVAQKAAVIENLFADAEAVLSPDAASSASTFIGALAILLREGLEALLVVVAMIAFLGKADRREVLPYVHGGWIAALLAGGATWAAATYAISISGASRELTEGFGSLFAAVVLVSVGIWMHGKSQAESWQRYIREALGKALSRRSAWFLFGLAFLVVYREAFETILFFAALAAQGNEAALAAGAATAIALLAAIAWVMLRYSRTLPIGKFFAYSSALIAILAVVLAGKGAAALQEAGLIDITPIAHVPRVAMLGVFPSLQPLFLQFLALAALVLGFRYNNRSQKLATRTAK